GSFDMSKERRHGRVSAQSRAVHVDEFALHGVPRLFQFMDSPGEFGLSGARRTHQQKRIARGDGHLFDAVDQSIEGWIPSLDTSLKIRDTLAPLLTEASRDPVVL